MAPVVLATRSAEFRGPCLHWSLSEISKNEDEQNAMFVDHNTGNDVSFKLIRLLNGTYIEVNGERVKGPVNLSYRSSEGLAYLHIYDLRESFALPPSMSHQAVLLPDLCSMFNEASVGNNLTKLGFGPLASTYASGDAQEMCSCSIM